MRKAAVVNPYWDTLGGGERYTASFIKLLLSQNWEVDVRWPGDLPQKISTQFGLDISQAKFLPQLQNLQTYDLLFWVSDGSLPVSRADKTIIHLQFPFKNIGGKTLVNILKSRFYTFVVNSQFTKKFIDREFMVNSRVIYPPVSVENFQPGNKENTILYVGRFSHLVQNKHHDILVKAFTNISSRHPDWKMILAGGTSVGASTDGVSELKRISSKFPIEFVFDPDFSTLKSLYAKAKIFWSASGFGVDENEHPLQVEHFGISLVESMAAGCVPFAVSQGGHREIIESGKNGYLWRQTSELESLTEKIMTDNHLLKTLSMAAQDKSKIFSTTQFNSAFSQLIKL